MNSPSLAGLLDSVQTSLLVIKIGSSLIVGKEGAARKNWMDVLAGEVADQRRTGQRIVIVSSGAIALGAARLNLPHGGRANLADAQAAAAVGQIALAGLWSDALARHGLTAAQLLLTLDDLEDRRRYLNASATLQRLLDAGAVPVVNENDSVATGEIRFGDNDRLAARIAQAAGAGGVLLMSDVDGLYTGHPHDEGAELVPVVTAVNGAIHAMAGGADVAGVGTGGMAAKVAAAEIAGRAGITLAIVNGTYAGPLGRLVMSKRGTLFMPSGKDRGRKAWLGGRKADRGALVADAGCIAALRSGASLLAAGIVEVEGDFSRGDLVTIRAEDAGLIGRGLVEYSADDCRRIMGMPLAQHEAALGHMPRSTVMHRDSLVLL
ncbi:glutamate 5-kinase [Pseudopontixanthobacter vadosimaris]|uniref:glutamate 5-kinase n=1 Tax=Pseudopontixanthobacter vadosimaris TaxID=2726450 RepID=UPI001472DD0D|nr:glutamate 5-kinase [Pseudopontixanthobacter vadosimaris]